MTWEHILKGTTIRKGKWDFSDNVTLQSSVEIKNSPFERKYSDNDYDNTEYGVGSIRLEFTIQIETRDYGIKSLYPWNAKGNFDLRIEFEHDDYDDDTENDHRIEGGDYSTIDEDIEVEFEDNGWPQEGDGPNFDGVEDMTIDMKNEKDPSKWEISGTLRRGGPY
jgi:hypothetical protein